MVMLEDTFSLNILEGLNYCIQCGYMLEKELNSLHHS